MNRLILSLGAITLAVGEIAIAAAYERGPLPPGGQVFYAFFDNGPKADAGAGFVEMRWGHVFDGFPARGELRVSVSGEGREITEVNNEAVSAARRDHSK